MADVMGVMYPGHLRDLAEGMTWKTLIEVALMDDADQPYYAQEEIFWSCVWRRHLHARNLPKNKDETHKDAVRRIAESSLRYTDFLYRHVLAILASNRITLARRPRAIASILRALKALNPYLCNALNVQESTIDTVLQEQEEKGVIKTSTYGDMVQFVLINGGQIKHTHGIPFECRGRVK